MDTVDDLMAAWKKAADELDAVQTRVNKSGALTAKGPEGKTAFDAVVKAQQALLASRTAYQRAVKAAKTAKGV